MYVGAVRRVVTERKQIELAMASGARQQKALFHLADEPHRANSMDKVYSAALNAILDALQCNRASILLCDEAGIMRFRSWRGLSNEYRAAVNGHSAWRPGERPLFSRSKSRLYVLPALLRRSQNSRCSCAIRL